ncbi:hypothetical protein E2562_015663 [Oryza meyeriana var. granulata]|uniref:Uncharacterized protein n=1 Tax=Oryza meyeriana var. granulata TaxID=110450 RepID=A0A6G1D451_9ORYZ|nr:hypothetical protein E2562_015663 [Oryza meyeriana var. granulata]
MDERPALPPPSAPQSPPFSALASPYSALHPLLLPSPNPHLLLKPKTLTLSLSSSSLASMPSSSPPAPAVPDSWELVTPTTVVAAGAAPVDGGLDDDCDVFPPRLHEGLGVEGEAEEAAAKEGEEEEEEDDEDFGDEEWLWGWGRCRVAARRAWAVGVGAVREGLMVHGTCGCPAVRPAVWSAAGAAVVVGALLYARRRDKRERDLLVLLSQEKDKIRLERLWKFLIHHCHVVTPVVSSDSLAIRVLALINDHQVLLMFFFKY